MSPLETFFACGFVSTFAVAILATWFRYLPTLISQYRILVDRLERLVPEQYMTHKFKLYAVNDRQAQP
jgi:hypothetical protein